MSTRETRRILLDGNVVDVVRHGEALVAGDGREVAIADATHLAPTVPSKIVCVHLNYLSRVEEMMTKVEGKLREMHIPGFLARRFTRNIPTLSRWQRAPAGQAG